MTVPLPDPSDPNWAIIASSSDDYTAEIRIPANLNIHSHPTEAVEGVVLKNVSIELLNSQVHLTLRSIDYSGLVDPQLCSNLPTNREQTGTVIASPFAIQYIVVHSTE